MENNSDKQLRDKLSGTEFPFDPQAWDKMDAMLDEKKKRRGFFWWWTGGIAAALLFGVIGYELRGVIGNEQLAINTAEKSEVRSQKSEVNTTTAEDEKAKVKSEKLKVNAPAAEGEQETVTSKEHTGKQETRNKKQSPTGTALISANPSDPRHPRANVFSKANKQLAISNKQAHKNNKQQTRNKKPATPVQTEIAMLNAAYATAAVEENISLSRMEASLLNYVSENAVTSFDKKEEDVLPKQKKKIFNYSLGVLANGTGTTLGDQSIHNPNVPIRNKKFIPFEKTPSYMVGFTHDFLFVNRVAITNSILFTQTSFAVHSPKVVSFSKTPTQYTSNITELAIPIGIKVYPVVKNNFRFYINTGIINHIKLKETFDYTYPLDTPVNNTATLGDPLLFPIETNFTGNVKTYDALGTTAIETSTKDFSINSAKRYYASFYAGAGFEYIAKKHFILFAEPVYYMSLQKIGVQDKRKYNFGLTGGFRYQF